MNAYELEPDDLKILELKRDEEWYGYIFHNRNGYPDRFRDVDVLIGPIANDTIYDTWGILTSGFLSKEKSLKLLSLGPEYSQVVIKSSKALSHLRFLSSSVIPKDTVYENKKKQREEEKAYQEALLSHLKDERELFE